MRLQLIAVALVVATPVLVVVAGFGQAAAQSDGAWQVSSDTLLYTDDDSVLVITPQVSVKRELDDDGGAVSARAVVDIISAASVDVISEASTRFDEVRTEADLSISKAFGKFVPSLGYRISMEPDYHSQGARVGLQTRLGTSDSTLAVNYGATFDTIGRSGTSFDLFSESLTTHAADLSFTQVIDPKTLVRLVYSLTVQDGYLEKPYRHVPLFTQAGLDAARADGVSLDLDSFDAYRLSARPAEEVPDQRFRHALGLRAMRYLPSLQASLRVDYQFYIDSWGVMANMAEGAFYKQFGESLRLNLHARFYQQSAATFWKKTYVVSNEMSLPRWRTVDRSLSSYRSGGVGARIEYEWAPLVGYLETGATVTQFSDFLFLDRRIALLSLAGVRWEL